MSSKNAGVALVARFLGRQNTIPISVPFVQLLGDYTAAAFLSQCMYWSERTTDPDGWFYKTHADWYEELLLSPDQVRRCTRTCEAYVEAKRRGVLGKTHYRIRVEALEEALQMLANPTSRNGQTPHQDVGKAKVQTSGNPTSRRTGNPTSSPYKTKTTAETTAERKGDAAAATAEGQEEGAHGHGGADRTPAPGGAKSGTSSQTGERSVPGGKRSSTATDSEEVPGGAALRPGERALRTAMGDGLYDDCLAEDPDRQKWGDLDPARISELRSEAKVIAQEQQLKRWRTPFIELLDREILPARPAATPSSDPRAALRARILRGSQ